MRKADADNDAATALITRLEKTRAKRNTTRTLLLLRMYRLLTADQRAKLLRLQRRYTRPL